MFFEELLWRTISQRSVNAGTVVERLDVFEDCSPGLSLSGEYAVRRKGFPLQRSEKRFAGGVVVAVSCSTHALGNPAFTQPVAHRATGILAAPV